MVTEHVEQDKQPEQSEDSFPLGWNVTTSRMVTEFYEENRVLWDKNHKDYGKNSLQKEVVHIYPLSNCLHAPNMCLVIATCHSSSVDETTGRSDRGSCRHDVSQGFVA